MPAEAPVLPDSSDPPPERGGDAATHTVHLRFAHTQGRRLRASATVGDDGTALWTERPLLMQRADGSYDLIGTTARLDRLARWILSHGTAATVQTPEALRRRVAGEAAEIAQTYDIDGLHDDGR